MFNHDMEWASPYFLELMSQPSFHAKRVGYLAASQSFTPETDMLVMTPQLLRKDFKNPDQYINGLAMNCLSNIVTEQLGAELVSEVVALLVSSRPYVRKRALTLLYKIFVQYPDALRPAFPKIQDSLKDNHPSVQACAMNVICELASKNPKNYLPLAPVLYNLLKSLHNNWTLIKIVKLLGTLTPHEKRLGKKLVEPMIELITNTQAKSLLYECCYTVTKGMQKHTTVVKLAVDKLKEFVVDPDQNLKYLGLLGLSNLMNTYPRLIADLKSEILDCLHDEDLTIRYRAVELLCGVITPKNIKGIMKRLLTAVEESTDFDYKNFLIERIIQACARENYANIQSFKWYIRTLIALSEVKGLKHADLISDQFMNVLIRVKAIRPYGVEKMVDLLDTLEYNEASKNGSLLASAAWLTGEFISEFDDDLLDVIDILTSDKIATLPPYIVSRYINAMLKVYAEAGTRGRPKEVDLLNIEENNEQKEDDEESEEEKLTLEEYNKRLEEMREKIRIALEENINTADVEVQERSAFVWTVLNIHEQSQNTGSNFIEDLSTLFKEELNPVAKGAQLKVPVPEGLDLDSWIGKKFESKLENINELIGETWETPNTTQVSGLSDMHFQGYGAENHFQGIGGASDYYQQSNVFLLPSQGRTDVLDPNVSKIIDVRGEPIKVEKKKKKKRHHKKSHKVKIEEAPSIITTEEMPEGATPDDVVTKSKPLDRLSQVDLSKPITEADVLPTIQSYPQKTEHKEKAQPQEKEEKSTHKKKHRHHRKEKDEEDGKKKHRKHKHRSHEPKEESNKATLLDILSDSNEVSTSSKPKERLGKKSVCSDNNIEVFWNAKVKPSTVEDITLPFTVNNKANQNITEVSYIINKGNNGQSVDSNSVVVAKSLEASSKKEFSVNIKVKDFRKKIDVSGHITYLINDQKKTIDFSFDLPTSLWMNAALIETQDLANLILNTMTYKASTIVQVNKTFPTIDSLAKEVCRNLRLSVVQRLEGQAYNLYSRSLFGNEHLALQLKISGNNYSVDFKSSNESLLNQLLVEFSKLAKQ